MQGPQGPGSPWGDAYKQGNGAPGGTSPLKVPRDPDAQAELAQLVSRETQTPLGVVERYLKLRVLADDQAGTPEGQGAARLVADLATKHPAMASCIELALRAQEERRKAAEAMREAPWPFPFPPPWGDNAPPTPEELRQQAEQAGLGEKTMLLMVAKLLEWSMDKITEAAMEAANEEDDMGRNKKRKKNKDNSSKRGQRTKRTLEDVLGERASFNVEFTEDEELLLTLVIPIDLWDKILDRVKGGPARLVVWLDEQIEAALDYSDDDDADDDGEIE